MGLAFLLQSNKPLRKRWDEQRAKLSAPNLFSQLATSVRTVIVTPLNGFDFCRGQLYEVDVKEERLYITHGRELVGICQDPARSVVLAANEAGGKVLGEFHAKRKHSGVVEIVVCPELGVRDSGTGAAETDHENRPRTKVAP